MKVAFFSRLKEIKIPLLSLFYALLFSTRISSRLCAGSFRRERISLNLFFLPSEEEYYVERVVDARRTRAVVIFCVDFLSSFPSLSETTEKKIRERKGRFQKGSFPTKTKKNCRTKRPINMPSEGKLEGENARKHTLLSINKTPNNTSSLHQMSGFFASSRYSLLSFFSRCSVFHIDG